MIFNSLTLQNRFNYICNGVNDNVNLLTFIAQIQSRGYSRFIINIIGEFKVNGSKTTVDSIAWSMYLNNTAAEYTLDFSQADEIEANGNFILANNVKIIGCRIKYSSGSDVIGVRGLNSTFIGCSINGNFSGGACYGFSGNGSYFYDCQVEIYNASGNATGIYGTYNTLDRCNIKATSNTGSAYAADLTSECRVSNSRLEGITNAAGTTTSGNGGVGGGYYTNCILIGKGGLKGHGLYLRAAHVLAAANCVFRGYTKNPTSGLGAGISGAGDEACTYMLHCINCNQAAETGYSQTDSIFLQAGYGVCTGMFYTAAEVPTTFNLLAGFNRNRV